MILLLLQRSCCVAWRRARAHINTYVVLLRSCHSTGIGCISNVAKQLIFQLSFTLQAGLPSRSVTSFNTLRLFIFKLCIFPLVALLWENSVFVFVSPGIIWLFYFIFLPLLFNRQQFFYYFGETKKPSMLYLLCCANEVIRLLCRVIDTVMRAAAARADSDCRFWSVRQRKQLRRSNKYCFLTKLFYSRNYLSLNSLDFFLIL